MRGRSIKICPCSFLLVRLTTIILNVFLQSVKQVVFLIVVVDSYDQSTTIAR